METSEKQRRLCEKCHFLSLECWDDYGNIYCMGDIAKKTFVMLNGFEPLPKHERFTNK